MLANRLRKNERKLASWRKQRRVQAYRVYDRDIPEIPLSVERYGHWAQVALYHREDRPRSEGWLRAMRAVVADALQVPPRQVVQKRRQRQRGTAQYEKVAADRAERIEVSEGSLRFWVDLHSYVDTGLFLDHRPLRRAIGDLCAGKRLLNLFCYTGSFTAHAANGGAKSTTSVDLSRTYLAWAEDNLELNGLHGPQHEFVQADVLQWLQERAGRGRYDIAVLDPPTFSNSKQMQGTLDIQRDHVRLCRATAAVLKPGATLFFSTNRRRFKFDLQALAELLPRDITSTTIPRDFRDKRIHQVWQMTRPFD